MKSIMSKAVATAVIAALFSLNLQAATLPSADTGKMSKMKMDKKMDKKKTKMSKMKKDTASKM